MKKILVCVLSLALLFALIGCSSNNAETNQEKVEKILGGFFFAFPLKLHGQHNNPIQLILKDPLNHRDIF